MTASGTTMAVESFQTLDVTRFRQALAKLHDAVGCGKGRIEVTRKGCDDVCVLISKCELEALERAIEILTDCVEYKSMCDEVAQVAAATSGWATMPPTNPAQ